MLQLFKNKQIRRRINSTGFIILAIFLLAQYTPVSAQLSRTQTDAIHSGILYYNTDGNLVSGCTVADGGNGSAGNTTLSPGTQEQNSKAIFLYFATHGYTAEQAAGLIGNMVRESGVDPLKSQLDEKDHQLPPDPTNTQLGWGIVQWSPAQKILDYAAAVNKTPGDLSTQIEFLWKQLDGSSPNNSESQAGNDVKAVKGTGKAVVKTATDTFFNSYERGSKDPQIARMDLREAGAYAAYDSFASLVPSASVTSTGPSTGPVVNTGNCASTVDASGGGSIVQTALLYAWNDNRGDVYCNEKPEYKAAIDKAAAAGQYTGNPCDSDSSLKGIDCGGFVTRVMIDSGADPGYDYGGIISAGAGNTIQQKAYLDANSSPTGKYTKIGAVSSTATLLPGDIAINTTHTYIYMGKQAGFAENSASASQGTRAPMARPAYFTNNGEVFTWYRLK